MSVTVSEPAPTPDDLVAWMRARGVVHYSDGKITLTLGTDPTPINEYPAHHGCLKPLHCEECEKIEEARIKRMRASEDMIEYAHAR